MKTLCLYASKTGVTEDIAFALKEEVSMDVVNIKNTHYLKLDDYEKIIIGASVRIGRVIKIMRKFVAKNQVTLAKKKIGFFVSGADIKTDVKTLLKRSYPNALVEKASFMIHCGGEFRMEKLSFFSKWIIIKVNEEKVKKGDDTPVIVLSDAIDTLKETVKTF